jgi:hypothetical protein
MLKQK